MATLKIRFLVFKPNAAAPRRAFWQPTPDMIAQGWHSRRLCAEIMDPQQLILAAAEQAQTWNERLDRWRQGEDVEGGPQRGKRVTKAKPGTLDELIELFKDSRLWNGMRRTGAPVLGDKTKYEYERIFNRLIEWAGPEQRSVLTMKRVNRFYETMQKSVPAEANAIMRVGRLLWNGGKVIGVIAQRDPNPFENMRLIGLDKTGKVWPLAAVDAMVAMADAMGHHSLGTYITIEEWVGQRVADPLRLPRKPHRGEDFVVRQNKGGAVVTLPIAMVPRLVNRAAAELANQQRLGIVSTSLIVNEATKLPYTEDQIRRDFADVRAALAKRIERFECEHIPAGSNPEDESSYTIETKKLLLKDLRHTAVTRLGEAGCELGEIISISGHTPASAKNILATYLRRTSTAARQAFKKRADFERAQGVR